MRLLKGLYCLSINPVIPTVTRISGHDKTSILSEGRLNFDGLYR